jgi:hypothetical protein
MHLDMCRCVKFRVDKGGFMREEEEEKEEDKDEVEDEAAEEDEGKKYVVDRG